MVKLKKKKKEDEKPDVPDSICVVRCVKCKKLSKISRRDIGFYVCSEKDANGKECGSSLFEVDVK